ncbi:MAG TPA: toll/interleukin-1 receptor domain-containing protein [Ignavibacteriaceae bacterium]
MGKKIFLSHSGKDKAFAFKIATQLKNIMELNSSSVIDFFNTSEMQHRFTAFEKIDSSGDNFEEVNIKWENKLRSYLEQNLLSSDIYLLLVTKRSLLENSKWILFEMETAANETKKRGKSFFFPCLYNGASFNELPEIAKMFQALDLNAPMGFTKLATVLEEPVFIKQDLVPGFARRKPDRN